MVCDEITIPLVQERMAGTGIGHICRGKSQNVHSSFSRVKVRPQNCWPKVVPGYRADVLALWHILRHSRCTSVKNNLTHKCLFLQWPTMASDRVCDVVTVSSMLHDPMQFEASLRHSPTCWIGYPFVGTGGYLKAADTNWAVA
jgi:hypothetical protein